MTLQRPPIFSLNDMHPAARRAFEDGRRRNEEWLRARAYAQGIRRILGESDTAYRAAEVAALASHDPPTALSGWAQLLQNERCPPMPLSDVRAAIDALVNAAQ